MTLTEKGYKYFRSGELYTLQCVCVLQHVLQYVLQCVAVS